jgi:alcohol dehydrogenase class IV
VTGVTTTFDVATAADVRFGSGRVSEVPAALASLGVTRALVVTGRSPQRADAVRAAMSAGGVHSVVFSVSGEPSIDVVRAGAAAVTDAGCDGVLGLGGGSALDVAKAVAVIAGNGTDPLEHLEVIGQGRPFARPALPWVAVPTTAGTGSEVTRNAVLSAEGVKASLRSPLMLARVAVVDPDLLVGLGRPTLASSGLDALAQLIEPFLSARANPLTDALARDGMVRSARSLRRAWQDGLDDAPDVREDLALASLFGGLCLANSGLGAVHGFASAAGGAFEAPHGAVCAALLAATMDVNLRALAARSPDHPSAARAQEVAQLLTGRSTARAQDGIDWLSALCADLAVLGLGAYGITADDVPALVDAAKRASSMRANPITLTDDELTEIVLRSL